MQRVRLFPILFTSLGIVLSLLLLITFRPAFGARKRGGTGSRDQFDAVLPEINDEGRG